MTGRQHMGSCHRGAAVLGKGDRYGIVGNESRFSESSHGTLEVKVRWARPKVVEGTETWEFLFNLREVQCV